MERYSILRKKYDLYKLLQILEYRRRLDQIGDERNQFRLLSGSWSKWTLHVRKGKSAELLKYLEIEQIASLHWQRYICYPFIYFTLLFDGIVDRSCTCGAICRVICHSVKSANI